MRINMWGTMIGQLLLRSFERAERVDRAMRARGYTGKIRFAFAAKKRWNTTDTLYLTAWALCFAALTLLRPAQIFTHL